MELLRSGLSESSNARRWYLQRLLVNLTRQLEISRFQSALQAAGAGVSEALGAVIASRRRRLASQCGKLVAGAFGARREHYLGELRQDVDALGLQEIVLLPSSRELRSDAS
jgi:hypothetical protein